MKKSIEYNNLSVVAISESYFRRLNTPSNSQKLASFNLFTLEQAWDFVKWVLVGDDRTMLHEKDLGGNTRGRELWGNVEAMGEIFTSDNSGISGDALCYRDAEGKLAFLSVSRRGRWRIKADGIRAYGGGRFFLIKK